MVINESNQETANQLPDFIDPDTWKGFVSMRKKIKKPMTERAVKMMHNKLRRLHEQGHNPNHALAQSEFYNWQDVYPPKREWLESMGLISTQERSIEELGDF